MTMSLADWFSLTAPAMDAPAYFYITYTALVQVTASRINMLKQLLALTSCKLLFWIANCKTYSMFDGFAA